MTTNKPSYSEPGWGIGGDFPLSLSALDEPKVSNFYDYFHLRKKKIQLLSTARAALKYYLENIQLNKEDYFLLPSYLCPSLLQPFKQLGIPFKFYKIRKNLSIDKHSLASSVSQNTRGVLIIHYFGFPVGADFWDFWDTISPDIDLIEDCVQALLTRGNKTWCGQRGDYSIASFRKFFSVPDGAWLLGSDIPTEDLPKNYSSAVAKCTLGMLLKNEYLNRNKANSEAFEYYFKLLKEGERGFGKKIEIQKISRISKSLIGTIDFDNVRKQRRKNYNQLLKGLKSIEYLEPLFPNLRKDITPIGFPVLVETSDMRDNLKNFLVEQGVYAPIHWRLPKDIPNQEFKESVDISSCILTLPLDQRYGEEEMEYVKETLEDFKL